MRNSFLAALAVGATVLSASSFAQVSTDRTDYYPYNFSIKGGLFIPFDTNLHDIDSIWGSLGIEYALRGSLIRGSESFISADWIARSTNGGTNIFPIAINQRFYGKPNSSLFGGEGRSYFTLGVGAVFIETPRAQGRWLFRGAVGSELGERTFVEGVLLLSDRTNTALRANGFQLNLGYRF